MSKSKEPLIKSLEPEPTLRWHQHKLAVFIVSAISISFGLVMVAMALYNASGTALLDLSRPGYQEQRQQVEVAKRFKSFEPTGELDAAAIKEFRRLYKERVARSAEWAFSDAKVLSDKELGIADPAKD